MFRRYPFEPALQIADPVPQEAKLGLERIDARLNECAFASNVPGPGCDEQVVILLDQCQCFLFEWIVFSEETSDILGHEVGFEIGIPFQFARTGSGHPGFVLLYICCQCGDVLIFGPQINSLVEGEEVTQFLQSHGINMLEQNGVLPLEVISCRHGNLLRKTQKVIWLWSKLFHQNLTQVPKGSSWLLAPPLNLVIAFYSNSIDEFT